MAEHVVRDQKETIFYQGPSPDEVTLVEMAQQHGFEFFKGGDGDTSWVRQKKPKSRDPTTQLVTEWEEVRQIEFKVLRRIEFTSQRQRMSILVRDPDDGKYKLYAKGADSAIKSRLDQSQIDKFTMTKVDKFLSKASAKGYRTLLMAMKVLGESEVADFQKKCAAAESDFASREAKLAQVFDAFERDLVLVGATCVEDRLQDNVPETIHDL